MKGTNSGGSIISLNCNQILSFATLTDPIGPSGCTNPTTTSFNNPNEIEIEEGETDFTSIAVAGLTGSIINVTITVNGLQYGRSTDAGIILVGPQGQKVNLFNCAGGTGSTNNSTITFSDSAAAQVSAPVSSGTFKPSGLCQRLLAPPAPALPYDTTLSVLNGTNPNGTWRLYAEGFADDVEGEIAGGWALNITTCS